MKALNSANVKSVAIVGGGIGGLTSAYHFAHIASKLTIYDEQAHPGTQGASAVAAGLMHPFTPTGGVIWKGIEGFDKSLKVLNECQEISDENLFTASKIVRPIRKQEDLKKWKRTKEQHPEVTHAI
jgi:glycine/D-amino acid oxidase-like deaminating enzyme